MCAPHVHSCVCIQRFAAFVLLCISLRLKVFSCRCMQMNVWEWVIEWVCEWFQGINLLFQTSFTPARQDRVHPGPVYHHKETQSNTCVQLSHQNWIWNLALQPNGSVALIQDVRLRPQNMFFWKLMQLQGLVLFENVVPLIYSPMKWHLLFAGQDNQAAFACVCRLQQWRVPGNGLQGVHLKMDMRARFTFLGTVEFWG